MSLPANSRPDAFDVALVALSARALARSARRACLRALALDLFADADTREHAAKAVRVPARKRGSGFDANALTAALETHAPAGLPVVFGAGFEDATGLMAEIGLRLPIRGAAPETVALLKDPFAFAERLQRLGISHPGVADMRHALHLSPAGRGRRAAPGEGVSPFPENPETTSPAAADAASISPHRGEVKSGGGASGRWLLKAIGGSGGAHIRLAESGARRLRYAQQYAAGAPFSALFLADGQRAFVIGFSEQWTDPTTAAPFRYGGAVGPVSPPPDRKAAVAAALDRIVSETGLVGLASADMLAPPSGPEFVLLEINPRPGATLDLFDCGDAPSLLAAHLAACDGALPTSWPQAKAARAAAVVYAPRACSLAGVERPSWTADWPADGDVIPARAPICTVLAYAHSPAAARALVDGRRAALLASLAFVRRTAAASSPEALAPT